MPNGDSEPWSGELRQTVVRRFHEVGSLEGRAEEVEGPGEVWWDRPKPQIDYGFRPIEGVLRIEGHDGDVAAFWANGRFNHTSGFNASTETS